MSARTMRRATGQAEMAAALRDACATAHSLTDALEIKLLPLLALCEFSVRAHGVLQGIDRAASTDGAFEKRMDLVAPDWIGSLGELGSVPGHIGGCLELARALCSDAANQARELSGLAFPAQSSTAPQPEGGAA